MRQVAGWSQRRGLRQQSTSAGPNMRVALAHVHGKVEIRLQFGRPLYEQRLDRWRSVAAFVPGAICCTVRWFGSECGGPSWQLHVLRAPEPRDIATRIEGVAPRAQVLLRSDGEVPVQQVLTLIDCVRRSGVDPCMLPAAYWRRIAKQSNSVRTAQLPVAGAAALSTPRGPR